MELQIKIIQEYSNKNILKAGIGVWGKSLFIIAFNVSELGALN